MSTIFDTRKYLVLFTALALSLILWLTISFWAHAYVQRTDAMNIQASSTVEETLFTLASALSDERSLMYQLASGNADQPEKLNQLQTTTQHTDQLFKASFGTELSNLPFAQELPHLTSYTELNAEVAHIRELYRQIDSQRDYTLEKIAMPWNDQRVTGGLSLFKQYSTLIASIGNLRKAIHFVPRTANQEVVFQSSMKDSVWDLSEITAQIASLLESVLLLNESSATSLNTTQHAAMLTELNVLAVASWNSISHLARRYELNGSIEEHRVRSVDWYKNEYSQLSTQLMTALASSDIQAVDLADWLTAATSLHQLVDTLYENATSHMLTAVRDVEKTATNNLIIDTLLVLLCLVMAIAAFFYFKRIRRQAHQDELTGLSNRRQFNIDLALSIESAHATAQQLALVIIDLDRFKHINDSMGHAVGDRLLQDVANRIQSLCANTDHVARLGGDEFAILKRCAEDTDLLAFTETVRQSVADPFRVEGGVLQIGGSIGISHYPTDASTGKDLLNTADLAMYCAKKQGRNKIVPYDKVLADDYDYRVKTEAELQTALREGQFELYFQPKYNLALGKVDSVETLIRWHHPERGMVPPDLFIPIAEDCGLLPALGGWVLNESCRQAASWLYEQNLPLRVAVNVSAEQFLQTDFILDVQRCLKLHNLPTQYLELEVTESVVMADIDLVANALSEFKNLGIKIALDDFGTGYSSLSYLQDLPLDTLKIDKSFIQKLETGNEQHESITEAITDLAKTLGLDTVAEGVETDDQLSRVESLGISSVQGYYYSKPVPAGDINDVVSVINGSPDKRLSGLRNADRAGNQSISAIRTDNTNTEGIRERRRSQRGFTLVELLITVAIVGILSAVAAPQYRDFVVRARMSEVITFASMMKADAMTYYTINGQFPHDGGHPNRTLVNNSEYVSAVEHWTDDPKNSMSIHIYLVNDIFPGATQSQALLLNGYANQGSVTWNCKPHGGIRKIDYKYLPGECVD